MYMVLGNEQAFIFSWNGQILKTLVSIGYKISHRCSDLSLQFRSCWDNKYHDCFDKTLFTKTDSVCMWPAGLHLVILLLSPSRQQVLSPSTPICWSCPFVQRSLPKIPLQKDAYFSHALHCPFLFLLTVFKMQIRTSSHMRHKRKNPMTVSSLQGLRFTRQTARPFDLILSAYFEMTESCRVKFCSCFCGILSYITPFFPYIFIYRGKLSFLMLSILGANKNRSFPPTWVSLPRQSQAFPQFLSTAFFLLKNTIQMCRLDIIFLFKVILESLAPGFCNLSQSLGSLACCQGERLSGFGEGQPAPAV